VDVVLDTEVDPDVVARVKRVYVGLLGEGSVVGFESERDEPFAGCLFLEGDFFDRSVVRDWTGVPDFDPADFAEADICVLVAAPLLIEIEAGLIVRYVYPI
jgi:hypothetical protein